MSTPIDIQELLARPDYKEARANVQSWKESVIRLPKGDLAWLKDEISSFFQSMKKDSPDLYPYFRSEHLELLERISKSLDRIDIVLD